MPLASDQLEEIVAELITRPGHEKVRSLTYKLLTDGLGAKSRDITFEHQTFEVRGRMDALLGRTVIEVKSDLRREPFEHQLAGYLKDRRAETGQDYVGIVSDGATYSVHELAEDGESLERIGEFKPKVEDSLELLRWLESVVALQDRLPPDVGRIRLELGRESVLYPRRDPAFAAAWGEAERIGYLRLEAEALRRRREAMARISFAPGKTMTAADHAEADLEFWRTLHLLREHKRSLAGIGKTGRPLTDLSFDDAMALLEKQLIKFGVRIEDAGAPPPA